MKKYIQVVRFVRKLRGGSQPILVEGINGILYVLKFRNNLQGPNVLFNEAAGIQLYQTCGLPVPNWEPLILTNSFLERNRACWMEGPEGSVRPESGLCIGIRFVQKAQRNLFEILPETRYKRIECRSRFWLAWIVDICCGHTDNRQAVFLENPDGSLDAVFTDSGSLFGGPNGSEWPSPWASGYLDPRIYSDWVQSELEIYLQNLRALNSDRLLSRTSLIPSEWQTPSALARHRKALGLLSSPNTVESIVHDLLKTTGNRSRGDWCAVREIWRSGAAYAFSSRGMP